MNLELDDLALFVRITELGTLSAVARERNWPVSQVSRALARLEAACAVRLVHRSTHGLSLTDEGDTLVAHARQMLQARDVLASELTGKLAGPSGWVRVGVSPALAEAVIAPSLCGLYERHPDLHIDISADDRMADMARDGIDIAMRTGAMPGDSLVARRIGAYGRMLCASPAYLTRHGTPTHVADLAQHRLIASSVSPALNRWALVSAGGSGDHGGNSDELGNVGKGVKGGKGSAVQPEGVWTVQGHTRSDNSAATLALALHGVGMARLSELVARPHLASGALVPVLADALDPQPVVIYAVMLQERHRLPKVRACIDWWQQWLSQG